MFLRACVRAYVRASANLGSWFLFCTFTSVWAHVFAPVFVRAFTCIYLCEFARDVLCMSDRLCAYLYVYSSLALSFVDVAKIVRELV